MNNFRYENKTKVYFGKGSVGESLGGGYSLSVPFRQVVSGAFDTLSHAMETYFGKPDENNLSDDINEAVMRSVIRNIRPCWPTATTTRPAASWRGLPPWPKTAS